MLLDSILLSENPSVLIKENEEYIFKLIPEFKICKGFDQCNEWHPFDVYEHILHVVDGVPCDKELRYAALFHDVGKPAKFTKDDNGVGHFYYHWIESEKIFLRFCLENNITDKVFINNVKALIYYHDISINRLSDEEIENIYKILHYDGFVKLFLSKRSDLRAQNPKKAYILKDYDKQEEKVLKLKGE